MSNVAVSAKDLLLSCCTASLCPPKLSSLSRTQSEQRAKVCFQGVLEFQLCPMLHLGLLYCRGNKKPGKTQTTLHHWKGMVHTQCSPCSDGTPTDLCDLIVKLVPSLLAPLSTGTKCISPPQCGYHAKALAVRCSTEGHGKRIWWRWIDDWTRWFMEVIYGYVFSNLNDFLILWNEGACVD